MRSLFTLIVLALAFLRCISGATITPLPIVGLQPHPDNMLPSPAGVVGKMQVWLIVDWSLYDDATRKHPGRDVYWSARRHFKLWHPGDQRLFAIAVATMGQLPARDFDDTEFHVKAQDGRGGLVRAVAGDGVGAVVVVVDGDGRIQSLRRHTGDFNPLRQELDKLIGAAQRPLIAGPAEVPPGSAPALAQLKLGDAPGALMLALRKLGPDGRVFATTLAERANERIAMLTDVIGNPAQPPGNRFLAMRSLEGLVAEFPKAPNSAAAIETLKRVGKDDVAVQTETQGWNALGQYLTQAGRQSPTKLAAFQRQMLTALRERFPDTEAARIAGLILVASRIE